MVMDLITEKELEVCGHFRDTLLFHCFLDIIFIL